MDFKWLFTLFKVSNGFLNGVIEDIFDKNLASFKNGVCNRGYL